MASATVNPAEAVGKCSCGTELVTHNHSDYPGLFVVDEDLFRLVAKPGPKWRFLRFEWKLERDWSYALDGIAYAAECTLRNDGTYAYPKDGETSGSVFRTLTEGITHYYDGSFPDEHSTLKAVAYFERIQGSGKILHNNVGLILHGSNGTILYDD